MSSFITVHSGMFQQEPTGRGSVSRLRRMFYCGAAFHGCHYLPFDFAVEATLDNHHADIMQQPRAYVYIYIHAYKCIYIYTKQTSSTICAGLLKIWGLWLFVPHVFDSRRTCATQDHCHVLSASFQAGRVLQHHQAGK